MPSIELCSDENEIMIQQTVESLLNNKEAWVTYSVKKDKSIEEELLIFEKKISTDNNIFFIEHKIIHFPLNPNVKPYIITKKYIKI